jgi:hypothetical protein
MPISGWWQNHATRFMIVKPLPLFERRNIADFRAARRRDAHFRMGFMVAAKLRNTFYDYKALENS